MSKKNLRITGRIFYFQSYATTIVRLLQTRFGILPDRMIAGGRSEYSPKEYARTELNKKTNRRTEIYIMPKLDQFFQSFVLGSRGN